MSGCINACGHHHSGNIGILGVDKKGTELYQISLGGNPKDDASIGTIIGPGFRAEAVPQAIDTIVETYLAKRSDGETFLDTWRRVGAQPSRRLSMALLDLATGRLVADPAEPRPSSSRMPMAPRSPPPPAAMPDDRDQVSRVQRRPRHQPCRAAPRAPWLQGRDQGDRPSYSRPRPVPASLGVRHRRDHRSGASAGVEGVRCADQAQLPAGFRNPLPLRRDAARKAEALDQRLTRVKSLTDRIRRCGGGSTAVSSLTNLGLEDQAILHAVAESGAEIDVFTLDTGRLFPEVLETVELSELRYRIRIRLVAPGARDRGTRRPRRGVRLPPFGREPQDLLRDPQSAAAQPRAFRRARLDQRLRREHSEERANVPLAEWDEGHALVKVNPVADWTTADLTAYIAANNIPVNPLHARGFVSIGCAPCTRAVQPGENPRAGRWWWENEEKKECGLHLNPNREGRAA